MGHRDDLRNIEDVLDEREPPDPTPPASAESAEAFAREAYGTVDEEQPWKSIERLTILTRTRDAALIAQHTAELTARLTAERDTAMSLGVDGGFIEFPSMLTWKERLSRAQDRITTLEAQLAERTRQLNQVEEEAQDERLELADAAGIAFESEPTCQEVYEGIRDKFAHVEAQLATARDAFDGLAKKFKRAADEHQEIYLSPFGATANAISMGAFEQAYQETIAAIANLTSPPPRVSRIGAKPAGCDLLPWRFERAEGGGFQIIDAGGAWVGETALEETARFVVTCCNNTPPTEEGSDAAR